MFQRLESLNNVPIPQYQFAYLACPLTYSPLFTFPLKSLLWLYSDPERIMFVNSEVLSSFVGDRTVFSPAPQPGVLLIAQVFFAPNNHMFFPWSSFLGDPFYCGPYLLCTSSLCPQSSSTPKGGSLFGQTDLCPIDTHQTVPPLFCTSVYLVQFVKSCIQ